MVDEPAGTAFILDDASRPLDLNAPDNGLKYDTSGKTPVILVPQPSDDPNDPLNWPLWKRDSILVILSVISVLAVSLSPILAANSLTLSLHFERDFTAIALLSGYHLCGVGVAGLLFVASARVWGRRHLYLAGTLLLIVSAAWGGAAQSYKSFLWSRILQGVAVAPFEALVNASVGDLYFVHQRGMRMALSSLALFGSAFFTPIVVGRMTHTIGFRWTFYFIAIFSAFILPFVFFLVPETAFRREAHFNTDISSSGAEDHLRHHRQSSKAGHERNGPTESTGSQPIAHSPGVDGESEKALENGSLAGASTVPRKTSWIQSLSPFNGRKTSISFLSLLVRPLVLLFHPAILWACLIQGVLIGWTVLIGVVLAAIFLGPPLFFDEVKTGYMYTGAFVGALVGFLVSGLLSDWSARWMTKRNKGVYEPEFRIVLVILQLICGCLGLYGFGITSANVGRYGWLLPDVFFAFEVAGMVIGAVASALYIVDAYRESD